MIHAIIQEIIESTKKKKKVYELLYDEFTFFSQSFCLDRNGMRSKDADPNLILYSSPT